ncbi:N-acetylmuramoyl-L-alanine amidase [Capnocytophaga sp. HP1101]
MKKPTHSEIAQRNKALAESKHNRRDISEDSFHEIVPAVQVTAAVTQKYIQDYKDIAMVEMQRYNIPASITLAQGILESGSGQGRLARYGNNHFGIKCHATWNGKTITHDDDEKSECFRKYKYAYESFEDHSQFLVNRNRYKALFDLNPTDYESWAHGLKKAGYATDPTYARKLIALIKKFELHQYDNQVIAAKGGNITSSNTQVASVSTPKKEISKPTTVVRTTPKQVAITKPTVTKTTTVKSTNTIDTTAIEKEAIAEVYYQVQTGDTLYKIAREQQVSVQQLMKLNNFDDVASSNLKVGQQIRVN